MKGVVVGDLVDRMRRDIEGRLNELKPLVEEHARLAAAAIALDGLNGSGPEPIASSANSGETPSRRRTRRRGSKNGRASKRAPATVAPEVVDTELSAGTAVAGAGRPTRRSKRARHATHRPAGGGRAAQAVSVITENPGITISDLAKKMGVKRPGLYRILPKPEMEGQIRRQGTRWYPAGS